MAVPEVVGSWPALGEMAENFRREGDKLNLQPTLPKEKAGSPPDTGEVVDQGEQGDQPRGVNKKRGKPNEASFSVTCCTE